MTRPIEFDPLRPMNAHLIEKPLTSRQTNALELIGSDVVSCRTLVLARVGRSTLRALERRGLIVQLYDQFRATEAGLVELGISEDEGGEL